MDLEELVRNVPPGRKEYLKKKSSGSKIGTESKIRKCVILLLSHKVK
jgi:hypothetical protein